jgi:hypothetical protein
MLSLPSLAHALVPHALSWVLVHPPPTGGNTGIGFETAKALLEKDYHVVLGCRNKDRAEAARARLKWVLGVVLHIGACHGGLVSSFTTFWFCLSKCGGLERLNPATAPRICYRLPATAHAPSPAPLQGAGARCPQHRPGHL